MYSEASLTREYFKEINCDMRNRLVFIKRVPRLPDVSNLIAPALNQAKQINDDRSQVVEPHTRYIHEEIP